MGRQYSNTERAALGGHARAKKLSKKRRSESARRAATIRWAQGRARKAKSAA